MARKQHLLISDAGPVRTAAKAPPRWQLITALILSGLTMRAAVSSVGAVLDDIQHDLHTNSAGVGVLTTLPVVVFAVLGSLTPRLAARHGAHRLLVLGLALTTVGVISRVFVSSLWAFLLLSSAALAGSAVANVVLPGVVKRYFPDEIGRMTAIYSTALAAGATAAAGLTVPIGSLGDGWRFGTASWAVIMVIAILPWLSTLRGDRPLEATRVAISPRALLRSRTAVSLTLFFGFQSMQAYIAFGWYERFLHEHHLSSATAGWMVALYSGVSIPVSMVVPSVQPRLHRRVFVTLIACWGAAYAGFGLAPTGGAWLWMVLAGIGSGSFPLVLALLGLRSRSVEVTTALSAFVQAAGYLIAGTGPVLFGVLHGSTHGWAAPLALLWVALTATLIFGWISCAPRIVDDELAASTA